MNMRQPILSAAQVQLAGIQQTGQTGQNRFNEDKQAKACNSI